MLYGVTVSTSDSESGSGGSNPSGATTLELWQTWCNGSIPDSGSGGGGSNPSGAVYMEFVAERFRRKFVALVNAGSNPVKLPSGRFI